jgi:multiple sugar transport system permease protein
MTPAILILGVFLLLPILLAIVLAFHKVHLLGEIDYRYNGLNNFIRITKDERVWIALKNTVEYVAIVVPTQTLLALSLALILNTQLKGKNGFGLSSFYQRSRPQLY